MRGSIQIKGKEPQDVGIKGSKRLGGHLLVIAVDLLKGLLVLDILHSLVS